MSYACFTHFVMLHHSLGHYSLGRPDICLCQSWLVIGQFGCSGLPPSDANFGKGEGPPVNVKFVQYNFFNSWSNHTKLSDCDDYIAVL